MSKWFPQNINFNHSKFILFCFPFCGGGSSTFFSWRKKFPPDITICPIILPGREMRINEAFYNSLPLLVEDIQHEILPLLIKPFAIFGHSLGALIGFELIRAIQDLGKKPDVFFASAHRPPQKPLYRSPLYSLSDIEFEKKIREYGGTPEAILADPQMKQLCLKILRADFTIWETYQFSLKPKIECPIVVFAAKDDNTVSTEDLHLWQKETSKELRIHMLKGGHFFLKESESELINLIIEEIKVVRS